jgi:hypothetical protein
MEEQIQEEAFWHDSEAVLNTLMSDLAFLNKQLQTKDDQVWRRAYCRAVRALIESQTTYLKNYVLSFPEGGIDEDTKLHLCNQKRIRLRDGSEQTVTAYMPVTVQVVHQSGNNDGGLSPRIAAAQAAVR